MHSAFELRLSVDAPYRSLAGEVAGKLVELAGGTPADARAFRTEVGTVVDALAASGASLALRFATGESHVEVVVEAAGVTRTIRRSLAAEKD